ncbi:MAG: hypothetical protein K1W33_05515 [Clostridia bacterium]
MKKKKNLIVVIILIIILSLIILFGKDFIIRQYFIYKIENVDYDEYILTTSLNGKKFDISYYSGDIHIFRSYNDKEDLEDIIKVYDYDKNILYEYNIKNNTYERNKSNFIKTTTLNNSDLLIALKNVDTNRKFEYKGIKQINNRECYILFFEKDRDNYTTIYLDKELLYTVREEVHNKNLEVVNRIFEYVLDFTLKDKNLFEFDL